MRKPSAKRNPSRTVARRSRGVTDDAADQTAGKIVKARRDEAMADGRRAGGAEPAATASVPEEEIAASAGEHQCRPPSETGSAGQETTHNEGLAVPAFAVASSHASDDGAAELRFAVFVIDTGWNETAHKVLRKHIGLFDALVGGAATYWLDTEGSVAILRRHRELIGRDPILCVHDLQTVRRHGTKGVHGLRLHLGLLRNEDALTRALQLLMNFLARHQMSDDFEAEVHRRLHLEGLRGAVTIMAGGTPHSELLNV
jgi:hypothetical protein